VYKPDDYLPDFSGKVVVIQMPETSFGWTLLSPVFEKQGGKLFLVGKSVPSAALWSSDGTVNVPWDNIVFYVVFDSLEVYKAKFEQFQSPPSNKHRRGWFGGRSG
jgi:hypothetical protein